MAKIYDPNIIPDLGAHLPPGAALIRIESLLDDEATSTGKYQIIGTLRIIEPADMADQPTYERFVIGTDKDPAADDPNSWKGFAAQRYRDLLLKAGVAPTGNTDKDNSAAVGQIVGIEVVHEVQPDLNRDKTPNKYAGQIQARIKSYFRQGEKATGPVPVAGVPPAGAKPAAPAAKPVAQAQAGAKPATSTDVKCAICNQMVPRGSFATHVAEHEAKEE